jgi:hypothetical protein
LLFYLAGFMNLSMSKSSHRLAVKRCGDKHLVRS